MREPWSCGASCRQLGCRPSPCILGRLRWLLGLMAKNPAGFSPQHPKPQACAAPTGEEQTPGSWLWDRVDISSYRTSQSSGCLGYADPSAHPLQSPSGRGCHGGVVRCFVTEFLFLKKGPTVSGSSAWRLAGQEGQPLPASFQGLLLRLERVPGAQFASPKLSFL